MKAPGRIEANAPDILTAVFEGGRAARDFGAQFGDVKAEGSGEDAGTLAGLEDANGLFELLDHFAGGKLAEVAGVFLAIGVAGGDFGEGLAAFQFR